MTVISIQSQVVHGKVGNGAAVPALQAFGLTVAAVPTALLSNHPHYPTMRGRLIEPELLADLLRGVEERDLIDDDTTIITGFLGSVANARVVAEFVAGAKTRRPGLTYICDPVLGDDDLGGFAAPGLDRAFRDDLLPLADIGTPNAWELRHLTGIGEASDLRSGVRALKARGTRQLVVTGGVAIGSITRTIVCGSAEDWQIETPRLPVRPAGTGDLLTALLAARLRGGCNLAQAASLAVSGTFAVLEQTDTSPWAEMPIEANHAQLVHPRRIFEAELLPPPGRVA
jgi:pyridoxine kinase